MATNEDEVRSVLGEQPKALSIYLPDDMDNEMVWDANWKYYTTAGLYCRGDSEMGHFIAMGTEGPEFKKGEMYERLCADKGCQFAQGDKPPCRPVGVLSFKLVDVATVGVYQYTFKGMAAISRMHGFLQGLKQMAGTVAGIPFELRMVRKKGKFDFWAVEPAENALTQHALRTGERMTVITETEVAQNSALVDEDGVLVGTPQILSGEDFSVRERFALKLHEAIENQYIVGNTKVKYLDMLQGLTNLSEQEAQDKLSALEKWIDQFEESMYDEVSEHPGDERLAQFAFENLSPEVMAELEIMPVEAAGEMSRIDVRRVANYLETQLQTR